MALGEGTNKDLIKSATSDLINCPEVWRCLECAPQDCRFHDLLQGVEGGVEWLRRLEIMPERERSELVKGIEVCLEQGFCVIYCAAKCPLKDGLGPVEKRNEHMPV